MGVAMSGISATVRFLQEENQRLLQRNAELEQENEGLSESLKSLKGLLGVVVNYDVEEDLHRLLSRIVYEAVRIVDAVEGSLILIDQETRELVFVEARSETRNQLVGHRMPLGTGIVGWVVEHREPVIANDVRQDERFSSSVDQKTKFTTRSLIAMPLISRGTILGAIELINKFSDEPFDDRDVETLSLLSPIAATAIDLANTDR
jgi:GAF domain-containing protein